MSAQQCPRNSEYSDSRGDYQMRSSVVPGQISQPLLRTPSEKHTFRTVAALLQKSHLRCLHRHCNAGPGLCWVLLPLGLLCALRTQH